MYKKYHCMSSIDDVGCLTVAVSNLICPSLTKYPEEGHVIRFDEVEHEQGVDYLSNCEDTAEEADNFLGGDVEVERNNNDLLG